MNWHWTFRIERCDAILLVWDLFGLTPKSRHDLCEKAAEFVNKDMTIFMRSEKTTGSPLMNNIQGKGGVGVLFTPSWKKVCWRTPSSFLRQRNPKEITINSLITRFSSNGFRSSCCHIFPSDVCL